MLSKIDHLIKEKIDFAFETTLSTKSYVNTIRKAKENGYQVTLLFFWLDTVDLAIERVQTRVSEGGHDIPKDIIRRRYNSGIKNLLKLYIPICDYWMLFDNSNPEIKLIAEGNQDKEINIENNLLFEELKNKQ